MNPTSPRTHYRICPLCEACCGLEIRTEGPRVLSIRGHAADVLSQGYICPKAVALKDLHEDPDRLRQPWMRRGGRGAPLEPVSWDEAFAEIERRLPPLLAAQGRDALALSIGNPSAHKFGLMLYYARLVRAAGTRNVYSASTLDQMPKQLQSGLMYGHWLSVALPDIERTQWLLVIGANPLASNGSMWTVPDFRGKAKALRQRGGKLLVIDPRRSETAEVADEHHFIRPGTDVHLLAAMLHTLFAENLVRLGRLEPLLEGVEALRAAVQPFTPERAASRCGVPAETIRRLARELVAAPQAAIYTRIGTCTQAFGTTVQWLADALCALTGHLDEPGGLMFAKAPAFAANTAGPAGRGRGVVTGRQRARVSGAPEVFGELPMVDLAGEIETPGPGQVKALVTVASNPVLSAPNGQRLAAALEQLDFMLSFDIYLNETSRHADVILPGRSPLEDSHYDIPFPQLSWRNQARYSPPVFPASNGQPPESGSAAGQPAEWQNLLRLIAVLKGRGAAADLQALDDELLAEDLRRQAPDAARAQAWTEAVSRWQGPERLLDLALRLGPYGDGFGERPEGLGLAPDSPAGCPPQGGSGRPGAARSGLSLARLVDAPGGIDLGPLAPRLPEALRTPSGRVELAPPALLADLPRALQDLQNPPPEEGLLIIGRRDVRSNNSWMHNLPTLAKGPERCTLLVHPADALALGLAEGQTARISRQGRSITAPVQCSEAMMRGVVSLPHGWGHDLPGAQLRVAAERPGANLNAVLDDSLTDPLSGNAVLSGVAVQLSPA